jgi:haloacetate dehalogenase
MERIDSCEDANGIRIHYVREGKGPLVLLLHGWPSYSHSWRRVIPLLSNEYTVVAPDIRGYGLTDKPEGGYDKKNQAIDMAELVKKLGFEKIAAVVGHDRGARVAQRLGLDYPQMVERMVLIDMIPTREALKGMDFKRAVLYWHWFLHVQQDLPELFILPNIRAYVNTFFQHAYNRAAVDESLDKYVEMLERPGTMRAIFTDYRTSFGKDAEDDEASVAAGQMLTMPMLLLWGEKGVHPDKKFMTEVWKKYATDVAIDIIPQCGYYMHEEQPALLAERVRSFLRAR